MVPLLQGLHPGGEGDDLVADPVALQLVAADLIVHHRHIESAPGELLKGHPEHPFPPGHRPDRHSQTAHQSDFTAFLHGFLSSMP